MEMTVPSEGDGLATLHVYSNLIQMPVLVLSLEKLPVAPIKPERFSLSLDGGPLYRPSQVRVEDADPISLTIMLDFMGTAAVLIPKINEAMNQVTAKGLTPRDHVSLMVMQCGLIDLVRDMPAQPGLLEPKISKAIADWAERNRDKHAPPCKQDPQLWDTLALATRRLAELPGRRVIIAVTDGIDHGSRISPEDLTFALHGRAVTMFGVRPELVGKTLTGAEAMKSMQESLTQVTSREPFEKMSELSGGIALQADRSNAGKQFARIPELIRGRYILEFPRPANDTAGIHRIEVRVANSNDFIRVAGTSVPLADPKIAADPTTLPNDPGLTPKLGKSKAPPPPPPR
jgi:VWFA-related protein